MQINLTRSNVDAINGDDRMGWPGRLLLRRRRLLLTTSLGVYNRGRPAADYRLRPGTPVLPATSANRPGNSPPDTGRNKTTTCPSSDLDDAYLSMVHHHSLAPAATVSPCSPRSPSHTPRTYSTVAPTNMPPLDLPSAEVSCFVLYHLLLILHPQKKKKKKKQFSFF